MQRRRLIVTLPGDAYRQLRQLAEFEERAPDQQASLLLKRLLVPDAPPRGQLTTTPNGEAVSA